MHFTRSVVLSAAVCGAVQLTSAFNISSQCQNTLLSVGSSTDGQCLNAAGLSGLLSQSSGSSVVSPVDTWLQGFCSFGTCYQNVLANIVSIVTAGCGPELALLTGGASSSQFATFVQSEYFYIRQIICLKESSTLCVTQTLTNIQSNVGTLNLTELLNILSYGSGFFYTLPPATACTNCNKASYNIAYFSVLANMTQARETCGASFVNGSNPPGISQSAVIGGHGVHPSGAIPTISGVQALLLSLVGSALLVVIM